MNKFKNKYIGNKEFYRMILMLAIPIMIQNGITNLVNMVDNIMIGQVGTNQMTGVAIVNQLIFVFNLCIFGAIAGPGIFTAQFYGSDNNEGIQHTFRFKILIAFAITLIAYAVFYFAGDILISSYLTGEGSKQEALLSMKYAKEYLSIMLVGMLPFAAVQVYSGTLRECSEARIPMTAGIIAVIVNICFNYVLIFGKLGAPALGVRGAAIATVISRFAELIFIASWTHIHKNQHPFMKKIYSSFKIPKTLSINMLKKGIPLLFNEGLWAAGTATFTQCYSLRGLNIVAALNISTTISNVFNVTFIAFGSVASIVLGQLLGANKKEEAMQTAHKLIFAALTICTAIGLFVMLPLSGVFPQIYNTTTEVKNLATSLICVYALCMPIYVYVNTAYFIIRSGGKAVITFLFDSVFMWCFFLPVIFILSRYTNIPILPLYTICQLLDLIKCVIGHILIKKGIWLNRIIT